MDVVRDLYPTGRFDFSEALDGWMDALARVAHPDFVGGNPREELLEMASSVEGFSVMWRDWLTAWESWSVEILGHEEGSAGWVMVPMHITARSKRDSVEMAMHGANVVQVEDGRVKRVELYFDRDLARRAAGLEPSG